MDEAALAAQSMVHVVSRVKPRQRCRLPTPLAGA